MIQLSSLGPCPSQCLHLHTFKVFILLYPAASPFRSLPLSVHIVVCLSPFVYRHNMSRVITGLNAPPAQPNHSSRPLTLSERFAAIQSDAPITTTAAGWQTTSYNSNPAASTTTSSSSGKPRSAHKHSQPHSASSSSASAAPVASLPAATTSPTKPHRPARQLKLRGGNTVSVGASELDAATGGRKQRKILLQKEKRATALDSRRQVVKQTKASSSANSGTNGTNGANGSHGSKQRTKQQQQQQPLPQQPFSFVPPPFPSAFAGASPFTTGFVPPSAFPSAFHPGIIHSVAQLVTGGRGGARSGVKGRGGASGKVRGGGGGVQQQQQQQQRGGVKGKKGKAAVGTAARVVGAAGQRNDKGSKGSRRKSGKGGKPGAAAAGGGEVTSASLDSEMDVYHAGQ